ncbi:hypothetical protein BDV25DRAFT_163140 [Aspergillus avenaceus]|uniref:Cytochrome b561 domain-containing protein n=1 Tax=Aspergillus avenaceus TaxID=36643 RepID=A0A5N6TID5_ASPAV|nr:hypothetical protein BDV25DRAFT_163140 [Aspergillus avenaceus]
MPSPHTATRIHAPLQIATVCLALAGFGVGLSIANDLNELRSYHPIIGYVAIGGVVLVQPFLGIMGRRLYRNTKTPSLYGMSHRWLGRLFTAIGIINGGFGFYYAYPINPDIPAASPIAYGAICAGVGIIYVSVLIWRRRKTKRVGQC